MERCGCEGASGGSQGERGGDREVPQQVGTRSQGEGNNQEGKRGADQGTNYRRKKH